MPRKIEISHKTIIFTFLLITSIWFAWQIKDIIMILFVSILIMIILNPLVKKFSKFKIPRALSVLLVYFLFFAILIVTLAEIIPALVDQTTNFIAGFPGYISNLHISSSISDQISKQLLMTIGDLPSKIVDLGVGIISNIFTLLTTLTFSFYLLMARDKLDDQLVPLLGGSKSKEVGGFLDELETKLGGWARGQILLMASVGLLVFLGLKILGIPYALPLAILAGLLEIVPYLGPILGSVPSLVIGFGISPLMGVGVAAMAFLVQQVENYVLVPKIMERSVGVTPIVTLLSLAIGLQVAGIVGVLVSVPVVITLQVLAKRHFLV